VPLIEEIAMQVKFTRGFPDYRSAAEWLNANAYTESVVFVAQSGAVTITLEGEHAERAIAEAAREQAIAMAAEPAL
jgi:hypothetical protein